MTAQATAFEAATPTIGTSIAAARNAKGYSVHALSEQLGVDDGVIEAWEADEREPRSNRIQMLAGMLNVSIIWLITGESNGTVLLVQAGHNNFKSGKISLNRYMDNLAKVWAGLPLKSGRSYYHKYAGNRATISRKFYVREMKRITA